MTKKEIINLIHKLDQLSDMELGRLTFQGKSLEVRNLALIIKNARRGDVQSAGILIDIFSDSEIDKQSTNNI
jgi:hypothetical protein